MASSVSFRTGLVVLAAAALASLAFTPSHSQPTPDFGEALAGLDAEELERFEEGLDEFAEVETPEEGLGPVFNDASCGTCHLVPAVGGGSEILETRFGRMGDDGLFDSMPEYGGGLIQKNGIGIADLCEYLSEIVPGEATIIARPADHPALRPRPRRRHSGLDVLCARDGAETPSRRNQRSRLGRAEDRHRPERRRQVRLEGPGPVALPVLRRRLPERDGCDEPGVPGRELPRRGLRLALLQSAAGHERRRFGRGRLPRLHDVPRLRRRAARSPRRPSRAS